jgi:NADH:ubiquinone oxidoreductase subunit F (NADH-binding)
MPALAGRLTTGFVEFRTGRAQTARTVREDRVMTVDVLAPPVGTARMIAAGAPDHARHLATFGPVPRSVTGADLVNALQDSGLTGRGGAAFPSWRKIAAVSALPARDKARRRPVVVVGNAAEGEPLSAKDATLLRMAPHLVLDGLLVVAAAVHADRLFLYAPHSVLPSVASAVAERTDAGRIELRPSADRFVAGEASAVVSTLSGRRAVPRDTTERLTLSGLGGNPTLLHNVETLAQIALIVRFGAGWFRLLGTADEPGTRLVTVSAGLHTNQVATGVPGRVLEIAGGTRLRDILKFTGNDLSAFSAVLVGGYHGAWVPSTAFDLRLDRADLRGFGASPGAGVVLGLEAARCPLPVAAAIVTYLANESAGQCGPCVNGLPALADALRRLARGERTPGPTADLAAEAARLASVVSGRGACHHPDGTAGFVLSTLTVFSADVAAHLTGHCGKDHS